MVRDRIEVEAYFGLDCFVCGKAIKIIPCPMVQIETESPRIKGYYVSGEWAYAHKSCLKKWKSKNHASEQKDKAVHGVGEPI